MGRDSRAWREVTWPRSQAGKVPSLLRPAPSSLLVPALPQVEQLFLASQLGISLGNTLGDLDVLLWPGQGDCRTCRSWALVHLLLPTPDLARPTESNSNHVLNRNVVNQKPGWGDNRGERRGYVGNRINQNVGLGKRILHFWSLCQEGL